MTTSSRGRTETRGERVIRFISSYCLVPEGKHVGKPIKLSAFQKRFILDVYDNPAGTSRAYLSIGRKNGKTATIACLVLAHLVGPEAKLNSQIISGARSRDQAALVFNHAEKMVRLSPTLSKLVRIVPSGKRLIGLTLNVEYKAISAEAGTAHGLSPILAILDEVGQVRGPYDAFVEAIETAQGAHDAPLLIAISTQAATDNDLFSRWIDDAQASSDPRIVCHLYAAPEGCALDDREAWQAANPAMGEFRSVTDLEDLAARAERQPTVEQTFRWLYLNQRVVASAPFVSKTLWASCGGEVADLTGLPLYGGLDLSATQDLTALVLMGNVDGVWHVKPRFWLPEEGLREKARQDRVPYDVWHREGLLEATPGAAISYEVVAGYLRDVFDRFNVQKLAFDRWNFRHLRPWLEKAGFSEDELTTRFVEFGQGFASISPALREFEAAMLEGKVRHGGHPVLTMCAANAVVKSDEAGNRKLDKSKSTGRIDGMVALTMAFGVAPLNEPVALTPWDLDPNYRMAI